MSKHRPVRAIAPKTVKIQRRDVVSLSYENVADVREDHQGDNQWLVLSYRNGDFRKISLSDVRAYSVEKQEE